jgi:hypothetical protein
LPMQGGGSRGWWGRGWQGAPGLGSGVTCGVGECAKLMFGAARPNIGETERIRAAGTQCIAAKGCGADRA